MSILIKGMEMPSGCTDCPVWAVLRCKSEINLPTRPRDCPLVPVPAHGRLIDEAALWVEINKICDRRDAGIISDLTCLQQILSALRHAPTIIPAEE